MKSSMSFCLIFSIAVLVHQPNGQEVARCEEINARNHREMNGQDSLVERLRSLPGVEVKSIQPDSLFKEAYEIMLLEPLDHRNPEGKKFRQRIFLSHIDESRPVVMITEGYQAYGNRTEELSAFLGANQLRVEHRFFGNSKPDSMDWNYLTIEQAANDHHRIVALFKKLYPGKWVNTGWSKGGQTALIHRSLYPDDVNATVAYDAPLNFALEEPRIDQFFETVGTEYCRQKLIQFQRLILQNKDQILPRFTWYAKGKGYRYSVGLEKALEYIVLEYTFSFWQYHKMDCDSIPGEDASIDRMLEHLREVVSFSSYSDNAMNSPSMYQFSTQLGYYGYVTVHVKDLLSSREYKNTVFAPQNTSLIYDPEPMRKLNEWLQSKGNNILYIYGENDPWSAPAVNLNGKTNALNIVLKGGNHYTFINTFTGLEKETILTTLEKWLGVKIRR